MTYIQTFSGKHFSLVEPRKEQIDIRDIARALSNICRYTGHLAQHYSVAQHSVLCSHLVEPAFALDALLHDAAEAYIGDVSAPLKSLLPEYKRIETNVEWVIARKFGVRTELPAEVKQADLVMLATERRDVLGDDGTPWPILEGIAPARVRIEPWSADFAMTRFLQRFEELTK